MCSITKSIFIFSLFIFLWACGSQKLQVPAAQAFSSTFTSIRDRILIPRCANCHGGIISHKVLLAENKMTIVPGDAANSRLYTVIESGEMPKYGQRLTDEEISAIQNWIEQGAKND